MADVTISDLSAGTPNSSAELPYSDGTTTFKASVGQVGVPVGTIVMWNNRGGASIPTNWALCDGTNGTPDLRDKFIVGYSATKAINTTGGASTITPTGTIGSTTLGASQQLSLSIVSNSGSVFVPNYGSRDVSFGPGAGITYCNGVASYGVGHTHSLTMNTSTTIPPYYALAFIQKIS